MITLRELRDAKGAVLTQGVLRLVRQHRPWQLSIIGGEPLIRHRELSELLPQLGAMGLRTQVVTSAVRPIPQEWARIPRLCLTVSIDGLPAEHDERRKPATYERILKNIAGHQITVHWTLTRQQTSREGYLEEFVRFWAAQPTTKRIWFSLYTPQVGEVSAERLTPEDRQRAVGELLTLRTKYPKLEMTKGVIAALADPPRSPKECGFARLTHCVSADLQTRITPCQFGGNPDCANCGCMASAGVASIARHRLPGDIPIGPILEASLQVGGPSGPSARHGRTEQSRPQLWKRGRNPI